MASKCNFAMPTKHKSRCKTYESVSNKVAQILAAQLKLFYEVA